MGDENSVLSVAETRHLLRRSGFGIVKRDLERFTGMTRGAAAAELLSFRTSTFDPRRIYVQDAQTKWIKKLISTRAPLQEKLVLFWHDHFANNYATVQDLRAITRQNRLLRQKCSGNFRDLVKAISKDAAMMTFLDTNENYRFQPNENYSRELMELFTLGVFDADGNPNYTQEDIRQIARAFTGWTFDDRGNAYLEGGNRDLDGGANCGDVLAVGNHDWAICYPERGPKVIFKNTGQFGPGGRDFTINDEGEAEIDTVIDIIFEHRDTVMKNTVARYIGRRLFEFFAYPAPDVATIDAIVQTSSFDTTFDVGAYLRALFSHDEFFASMAPPSSGVRRSVKWPADLFAGTLRTLSMTAKGRYLYVYGGDYTRATHHLETMGQELFEPPSVFGWNTEAGWISSATLLARFAFMRDATSARGGGSSGFHPEKLIDLTLTDPIAIVNAVLEVLGVPDQLTANEHQALIDYLGPGPLDLNDYDTRNIKLRGLFRLVLQSPAYQTH